MRVTNSMVAAMFSSRLAENYRELAKINAQIASGKKFERPGDDPVSICRVLSLRTKMDIGDTYLRSIDFQTGRLNNSDAALAQVTELLNSASEIASKGSNGTYNQTELDIFAGQIDSIIEEMVDAANKVRGGGGNLFTRDGSGNISFNPDALTGGVAGAPGLNGVLNSSLLTETVDPVPVFWGDPGAGTPGSDSVFGVLSRLKQELLAGDGDGVRDTISALQNNLDEVLQLRSTVGARTGRLEDLKSYLEEQNAAMLELASGLEGVEVEKAAVELSQRQTAYEASLAAGTRIMQMSLLDFLK